MVFPKPLFIITQNIEFVYELYNLIIHTTFSTILEKLGRHDLLIYILEWREYFHFIGDNIMSK